MSPVEGGYDLSWHDLYHSFADLGNQNEYSAHFIKTLAVKENVPLIADPIMVPIAGSLQQRRRAGTVASKDSDPDTGHSSGSDSHDDTDEVVIQRRMCYTRDAAASYLTRSMQWDDYTLASALAGVDPAGAQAYSDTGRHVVCCGILFRRVVWLITFSVSSASSEARCTVIYCLLA
jgi:hypothetical protein